MIGVLRLRNQRQVGFHLGDGHAVLAFSREDFREQEMQLRKMRAQVQVFGLESAPFGVGDLVELVIGHGVVEISIAQIDGIEIEDVIGEGGVIQGIEAENVIGKGKYLGPIRCFAVPTRRFR